MLLPQRQKALDDPNLPIGQGQKTSSKMPRWLIRINQEAKLRVKDKNIRHPGA